MNKIAKIAFQLLIHMHATFGRWFLRVSLNNNNLVQYVALHPIAKTSWCRAIPQFYCFKLNKCILHFVQMVQLYGP